MNKEDKKGIIGMIIAFIIIISVILYLVNTYEGPINDSAIFLTDNNSLKLRDFTLDGSGTKVFIDGNEMYTSNLYLKISKGNNNEIKVDGGWDNYLWYDLPLWRITDELYVATCKGPIKDKKQTRIWIFVKVIADGIVTFSDSDNVCSNWNSPQILYSWAIEQNDFASIEEIQSFIGD